MIAAETDEAALRVKLTVVAGPVRPVPLNERLDAMATDRADVGATHDGVTVKPKPNAAACVTVPLTRLGDEMVHPDGATIPEMVTFTDAVDAMPTALRVQLIVCVAVAWTVTEAGTQASVKVLVATIRYAVSVDEYCRAPLGRLISMIMRPVLPGSADAVGARKT